MKASATFVLSSIFLAAALSWPQISGAQTVVFQTTFDDVNCPDKPGMPGENWRQSDYFNQAPGRNPCAANDGIGPYGGWTANGFDDRIIAAANYPGGGGGKGFRHWRGDTTNVNGGGLQIVLPSAVNEMWARVYMRYQLGFSWLNDRPHYIKDFYWNVGVSGAGWVFGYQGGAWGIYNGHTGIGSSHTWADSQGGTKGDGKWHCYEYHIQSGANARIEVWVDNVQYLSTTTDMPGPHTHFALGSNQNEVIGAGSTPYYTDYDDIVISTSGRVGCGNLTPVTLPPPQHLRVQ